MEDRVQGVIVYFGHDDDGHYVLRECSDAKEYMDLATWRMYVDASAQPQPVKNGDPLMLRIVEKVRVDIYDGDLDEIPADPSSCPQFIRGVDLTPDLTTIG